MRSIVLLSGPVGAGKTTVARELVASSPGPCAHIEGDVFWSFLAKTAPNQPRSKNFALIMRAMTAASSSYARAGYEAIVDFSIPPWFLDTARVVLKRAPKEYAVHYVVLRPSEAVCALRAASRATGTILDYAPYRELYAAFDAAEQYTIGDDSDDARALAARIRAGLAAGNFRLI